MGSGIPLHRCSCIISAVFIAGVQCLFFTASSCKGNLELVDRTDIIILRNIASNAVSHSNLLTLVDKRNAPKQNGSSGQHFLSCIISGISRQITACTPWLIMIFNDICFKPYFHIPLLDCECNISPSFEMKWRGIIPAVSLTAH